MTTRTLALLTLLLFGKAGLSGSDFSIDVPRGQTPRVKHFTFRASEKASNTVFRLHQAGESAPLLTLEIAPDRDGNTLDIHTTLNPGSDKTSKERQSLNFWPADGNARAMATVKALEIPRQTWKNRDLPGVLRLSRERAEVWLAGRLILNHPLEAKENASLSISPGKGTDLLWEEGTAIREPYEAMELAHLTGSGGAPEVIVQSGVPFKVWSGKSLSLEKAGWPEWKRDPGGFFETYDDSSALYLMQDGRVPFVQVPKADYVSAWVLALAEEQPGMTNTFTLRLGRRNGGSVRSDSQLIHYDFHAEVPYGADDSSWQVIEVPLTVSFLRNIEGSTLDVEMTKELRLARRAPDPCRFRWRPLGLPSNVKIAAITLEKSPIQARIFPEKPGALFEQPEKVAYQIVLSNITDQEKRCVVTLEWGNAKQDISLHVPARGTLTERVELGAPRPGYYPLSVSLREKGGRTLPGYQTAFGVLPPDTREFREEAPWGTWDFGGDHFTPKDPEQIGEAMQKLGLRYGMFRSPVAVRQRYGVVKGNEFKVDLRTKEPAKAPEAYRKAQQADPDLLPDLLIFHEDALSGEHATRIPDLFHNRPPYKLNAEEKKRFGTMWEIATTAASAMRKEIPEVKIHLGNGGLTLREEFYRHDFPGELFDTGGNESSGFGRPPETQPPDAIAVNASLWMDRQMLDAYGYRDKPLSQAYEVIYPATSPGNLSLQTQADYFIRHILHAMAWRIPKIRPGIISDVGNSYYQSNWGGAGLMTARADWAPKPAAIALATLTRVLDGASYAGFLETGSDSAYLLRFTKQNGAQVLPFWSVRGQREYTLEGKGLTDAVLTMPDGQSRRLEAKAGKITVTASASPAWLELPPSASIQKVETGPARYPGSEPRGKVSKLSSLETLAGWNVERKPDALLEYYNPMTPRRMGDFSIQSVEDFEGAAKAVKVEARPLKSGKATMPMYAAIASERGIELPGQPAEIGLWVNGNSGWGRMIYELQDASGQRWTSIGARSEGGGDWMADWLGDALSEGYTPGEIADWNTDDVFGLSRINFDGWRYVGFLLPGQYPGEGYHWPANSQWRWDKDGVVHYPLTLKRVIVELPEKVLYLGRYETPRRAAIYLRDLVSVERPMDAPKASPFDYVEEVQVTVD